MRERFTEVATLAAVVAGLAAACRPPPSPPDEDEATSSGTAATTEAVGTTFSAPDACEASEECEEGSLCVAPYDPGSDPPRGPGACVQACIEADDLARWCFDDAGCCGDLRCREVDGFCEPPPGSDSTDGTGGSSGTDAGSTGSSGTSGGTSGGTTDGETGGSTTTGGSSSSTSTG